MAALIGVAVMALVFFAQGREVKHLREWTARAPERAEEIARTFAASGRAAARRAQPPRPVTAEPRRAASAA
ncbi:MAG: hypothetical protein ACYCYN_13155, partial [Solirubrobacteraceae bacterium]